MATKQPNIILIEFKNTCITISWGHYAHLFSSSCGVLINFCQLQLIVCYCFMLYFPMQAKYLQILVVYCTRSTVLCGLWRTLRLRGMLRIVNMVIVKCLNLVFLKQNMTNKLSEYNTNANILQLKSQISDIQICL